MVQLRIREESSRQRCPLCQDQLREEAYSCPACGTQFHRACFDELGGCSTLGCARKGIKIRANEWTPRRPSQAPTWSSLVRMSRDMRLEPTGRVRLDVETWRESASGKLVLLFLVLSVAPLWVYLKSENPGVFWLSIVGLVGFLISLLVYLGLDDVVLLDPEDEVIYFQRAFYGERDRTWVGGFDDVQAVQLLGESRTSEGVTEWTWSIALRLAGAREPLRVVDPNRNETQLRHLARELASLLGVEVETIRA